jgi:protein gp37
MARRLKAMGQERYRQGFKPAVHHEALAIPTLWRKPRLIFVNSMSDLFHEKVQVDFIRRVFQVIVDTPRHSFQILTKRSARLRKLAPLLPWPGNLWMGVTVENSSYLHRIDDLRTTGAKVKFVSFEPLLGPVSDMDLQGIGWVIAGGESGPGARPMEKEWVRVLRDECIGQSIPFFFKQWGGWHKKLNGRNLDGRIWDEVPAHRTA